MKKIILSWAVLSVSALMAGDFYVGGDLGLAGNTHTFTGSPSVNNTVDRGNDYNELKLKLGYGEDGDIKLQGYFSIAAYDQGVFDTANNPLYEFGAELIKEFTLTEEFYPFIKAGAGFGFMDVNGYYSDLASEIAYNAGFGLTYKLYDDISVLAGMDYVHREWGNLTTTSEQKINTADNAVKFYLGVNYTF